MARTRFVLLILLLVLVLFTGCATHTNVTFNTEPQGAQVRLDGEIVGISPTTVRLSNGIWYNPTVVIRADGYVDYVGQLDKELKTVNLLSGLFLLPTSLLWVRGPEEIQYRALQQLAVDTADSSSSQVFARTPETALNEARMLGNLDANAEHKGARWRRFGYAFGLAFPVVLLRLIDFVPADSIGYRILDEMGYETPGVTWFWMAGGVSGATGLALTYALPALTRSKIAVPSEIGTEVEEAYRDSHAAISQQLRTKDYLNGFRLVAGSTVGGFGLLIIWGFLNG